MLLLACGTASGISAIFNAPIAGIIFTLEVLLMDFTIPFFIPLLISAATASVISQLLYPQKFFFLVTQDWAFSSIPFYVLLGLFCGLISVYTVRTTEQIEGAFERLKLSWKSVFLGGSLLCLLIFFFPPLYGEGYFAVTQLLKGNSDYLMQHAFYHNLSSFKLSVVLVAFLIMMLKPMATALTIGAGGNGGIFASSLVIGGFAGFIFSYTINLTGWFSLPSHHFIIAGMAGMLAGVIHAPLTSIFLIAEITGGYMLFIPLMLVCAIAYFFARRFDRYSLYHKSLIKNGIIPERSHFGDDVL
jgi:CIC family chloride channel protein